MGGWKWREGVSLGLKMLFYPQHFPSHMTPLCPKISKIMNPYESVWDRITSTHGSISTSGIIGMGSVS